MKISEFKSFLTEVFHYNVRQFELGKSLNTYIVPMGIGDPGVGKTAACMQAAFELEVSYHQAIIAQYDAGELAGLTFPQDVVYEMPDGTERIEKRGTRLRPDYLPDPMTEEGQVGFFNLDELPQAYLANQNIVSQMVNQWRVGPHEISPCITIVATGNKPENKAGTTPMPMHLRDRLTFIPVDPDPVETLAYFHQTGVHIDVCSYLSKNPSQSHVFTVGANANPTSRSWAKAGAILELNLSNRIRTEALMGTIGDGETTAFEQWLRHKDRMPDPHEVCRDPDNAPVFGNEDADVLYLLLNNLVAIATIKNLGGMTHYLDRLPNQEFIALWSTAMLDRHPELNETAEMVKYKMTSVTKVMI